MEDSVVAKKVAAAAAASSAAAQAAQADADTGADADAAADAEGIRAISRRLSEAIPPDAMRRTSASRRDAIE